MGISSREETYIISGPFLTFPHLRPHPPTPASCHEDWITSPLRTSTKAAHKPVRPNRGRKEGEPCEPYGWLIQHSPVIQPPVIRELVKSSTKDTSPNRHCKTTPHTLGFGGWLLLTQIELSDLHRNRAQDKKTYYHHCVHYHVHIVNSVQCKISQTRKQILG